MGHTAYSWTQWTRSPSRLHPATLGALDACETMLQATPYQIFTTTNRIRLVNPTAPFGEQRKGGAKKGGKEKKDDSAARQANPTKFFEQSPNQQDVKKPYHPTLYPSAPLSTSPASTQVTKRGDGDSPWRASCSCKAAASGDPLTEVTGRHETTTWRPRTENLVHLPNCWHKHGLFLFFNLSVLRLQTGDLAVDSVFE